MRKLKFLNLNLQIIITTQNPNLIDEYSKIDLSKGLGDLDIKNIFEMKSGLIIDSNENKIKEIKEKLGNLPLVLVLVSSFIKNKKISSFKEFLQNFDKILFNENLDKELEKQSRNQINGYNKTQRQAIYFVIQERLKNKEEFYLNQSQNWIQIYSFQSIYWNPFFKIISNKIKILFQITIIMKIQNLMILWINSKIHLWFQEKALNISQCTKLSSSSSNLISKSKIQIKKI